MKHPQLVGQNRLIAVAASFVVVLLTPFALSKTYSSAVHQDAKAKLTEALSTFVGQPIAIDAIKASPANGLLEVKIADGPIIYATEDGAFFFLQGDLHGTKDGEVVNLTEAGRVGARQALVGEVSLEDMIIFAPEDGAKDYITVFTDVSCGYCQKLHREVAQLNDYGIEVRYLAWPSTGIPSEGAKQLETAWCSEDPQGTLTRLKSGVSVPNISCNSERIAAQFELGSKLGVRGTPAIVTSEGQLIPGYQPAANIAKILGLN